jgi:tetratricopeptide (TPR) repeat protein
MASKVEQCFFWEKHHMPTQFCGDVPSTFLTGPVYDRSQEKAAVAHHTPIKKTVSERNERLGKKKRDVSISSEKPLTKRGKASSDLFETINKANAFFFNSDYVKALPAYEDVLKIDPSHFTALYRQSVCSWKLGSLPEAIKGLNDLLKHDPSDAEAWATRGAILIQLYQYDKALSDLKRSVSLNNSPDFIEHILLPYSYYSLREIQKLANENLPQDPQPISETDLYLLRGLFLGSQKNYCSAIEALAYAAVTPTNSLAIAILETMTKSASNFTKAKLEQDLASLS